MMGIGDRYFDCSFTSYSGAANLIKEVEQYFAVLPIESNAVFEGKNGTGKTHLAIASIRYILQTHKVHYKKIIYIKLREIVENIRAAISSPERTFDRKKFENIWLLIIDDVAADYITDIVKSELVAIIDYRYDRKRPVIITTDLDIEIMNGLFGARCASRLYSGKIFRTSGPDKRIK
jgi:DNA replication protein DnaC